MIDRTLSRYRISAKLSEGGMGSVWLAEDTLLGRAVALKLLAPHLVDSAEARERFVREARTAARLAHPGIATVHDAGEAEGQVFIAYQFVDGETLTERLLTGPLPLPELLRLASAAADALAHAHERGQLHGCLSGASIMLPRDGPPVIMDFGLARPLGGAATTTTVLTLASARSLAPEQWRGDPTAPASDLWALGVVLYEAATAQLPFAGETPELVMSHVLHDQPRRPSRLRSGLPPAFDQAVMQLLHKEVRDRPAGAAEVAAVFRTLTDGRAAITPVSSDTLLARTRRWLRKQSRRRFGPVQVAGTVAVAAVVLAGASLLAPRLMHARERILAVLPMQVAGGDSTEASVAAEALGEELVGRLHVAGGFRVLPWVTSGRPLAPDTSLVKVAEGMRATELLTGTITSGDEDTRVHLALVDGRSGLVKSSRDLSAPAGDYAALQGHVALSVAESMTGRSSDALRARIAADAPRNPEAYGYFIRGAGAWHSGDPERVRSAQAFFEQALALDSTLASAWVARGAVFSDRYYRGAGAGQSDLLEAERCMRIALRQRPGLPTAERGLIKINFERRAPRYATENLEIAAQALRRDAQDVDQLRTAVWGFLLGSMPELAIPAIEHALKLDPTNQELAWFHVVTLSWAGYPARCLAAGEEYIRRFGEDFEIYKWMGMSSFVLQKDAEAIRLLRRSIHLGGDAPGASSLMGLDEILQDLGDEAGAKKLITSALPDLERQFAANPENRRLAYRLAATYALVGDTSRYHRAIEHGRRVFGPDFQVHWVTLARAGLLQECLAALRARDPEDQFHWMNRVDSIGLEQRTAIHWLSDAMHSPEYLSTQQAIDRRMVQQFEHYRVIVARALPTEPDVPGPRKEWPPVIPRMRAF